MPWPARDFAQHQLRRRASRPQLKRDPLGSLIHSTTPEMSARRSSEYALCAAACSALLVACHPGPSARADVPAESQWTTPAPCDTSAATSQRLGAIKAPRDSLLRDVQVRRAWHLGLPGSHRYALLLPILATCHPRGAGRDPRGPT